MSLKGSNLTLQIMGLLESQFESLDRHGDPVIEIFLVGPVEYMPSHTFTWRQKPIQFFKCCVLFRIINFGQISEAQYS